MPRYNKTCASIICFLVINGVDDSSWSRTVWLTHLCRQIHALSTGIYRLEKAECTHINCSPTFFSFLSKSLRLTQEHRCAVRARFQEYQSQFFSKQGWFAKLTKVARGKNLYRLRSQDCLEVRMQKRQDW